METDRKAVGDVVVRHTCDGRPVEADRHEKRMVYVSRKGDYYIMLWTLRFPVTRVQGTKQFICEFAGSTAPRSTSGAQ